jgi:CRP-like cAMP-binding protein
MRVQAFSPGQYIIRQGEEGSRFYIINEGEVRCTRSITPTQEEELIRLCPQEFFGERALITNEPRKANVIAIGHVECLVLERSNFQSLLAEVQDDMQKALSKRDVSESTPVADAAATGPITNFKFDELRVMRTIGNGSLVKLDFSDLDMHADLF